MGPLTRWWRGLWQDHSRCRRGCHHLGKRVNEKTRNRLFDLFDDGVEDKSETQRAEGVTMLDATAA